MLELNSRINRLLKEALRVSVLGGYHVRTLGCRVVAVDFGVFPDASGTDPR
jgi:hypothetical protein